MSTSTTLQPAAVTQQGDYKKQDGTNWTVAVLTDGSDSTYVYAVDSAVDGVMTLGDLTAAALNIAGLGPCYPRVRSRGTNSFIPEAGQLAISWKGDTGQASNNRWIVLSEQDSSTPAWRTPWDTFETEVACMVPGTGTWKSIADVNAITPTFGGIILDFYAEGSTSIRVYELQFVQEYSAAPVPVCHPGF